MAEDPVQLTVRKWLGEEQSAESIQNGARYSNGYKYCSECMVFFKTRGVKCRYCGNTLRAGPRSPRLKTIPPSRFIDPEKYGVSI